MRHPYYLDWQCCRCGLTVRTYLSSPRTVNRFAELLVSDLVVCSDCMLQQAQDDARSSELAPCGVIDTPLATSAACVLGCEDAGRDVSRPVVPAAVGCTAAEPRQGEESHTGPVLVKKTDGGER